MDIDNIKKVLTEHPPLDIENIDYDDTTDLFSALYHVLMLYPKNDHDSIFLNKYRFK